MNMKQILSTLIFFHAAAQASYFPTPLTTPDASSRQLVFGNNINYAASIFYEEGSGSGGFNSNGQKSSLGSMYSPQESFLTMLRNPQGTLRTNLAAIDPRLLTAPDFGGKRGAIDLSGHIFHRQITLGGAANLQFIKWIPGFIDLGMYTPFVVKRFDAINIRQRAFDRVDIIDFLLENIVQNSTNFLQSNGGLKAEPWQAAGIGDPTIILRWNLQQKFTESTINDAHAHLYFGFSIPASKQKDEDNIFALPLGNDGHWGIPFGGNFELTFTSPIKMGIALDLLWLIAESRPRRIKTDLSQTSLLLLNKTMARNKPGLTWRANWTIEGNQLWRGLSLRGGYELTMHHNDVLEINTNGYSSAIANTTGSAQSWHVTALTAAIRYDLTAEFAGAPMTPYVEGFLKFPVSGQNVVNANSAGLQMVLRF